MVEVFAILYIIMQIFAVLMAWPQIRKLYIAKQSEELSLTTWAAWLMSSLVTTMYASLTEQTVWMCANIAWALFYTTMVTLIVRYRRQTIYQQVLRLFRRRFYFSVGKIGEPADVQTRGLLERFRKPRS